MSMTQEEQGLQQPRVEELMIPAEKVAHVQGNNPLEHALLVLVRSGYFAVPVLDSSFRLVGTISKTTILDQILGLEGYETDKLSDMTVADVMDTEVVSIAKDATFMQGLKVLIDAAYACVIDENGYFDGILTRRAVLKEVNKHYYNSRAAKKDL